MQFRVLSLTIILIYIAILFLTSRFSKKSCSKHNPWYIVAISMISTSISGVTFVSVPGMVGASSFAYLQMILGFVAGYVVIAFVLLPLYFKLKLSSLYEYLDSRFGHCSYKAGASFFLVSKLLGAGVRMYLSAIVLQLVVFEPLGVPFWVNVLLTVGVVWLYTLRGLRSLVWTDMVQTLSLLTVVALSIIFISRSLGIEAGGMVSSIRESSMSRIFFFDDPGDTRFFFKQFFAGMFTTIAMTGLDQDMMQKNLSCRHLRDSQKNVLSYGVAFLPVNLLFLCLGVLLYRYASKFGIVVAKPDELFATITGELGVVRLLFVLGLVAASLSSSGSALNALTTSFTVDILGAKGSAGGSIEGVAGGSVGSSSSIGSAGVEGSRRCVFGLRFRGFVEGLGVRRIVHGGCAVALGLVILSFKVIGNESVINAVYTIASYTYGPLLGLYFFGIFTKLQPRDKFVPLVCVLSPLLCFGISLLCNSLWGYTIGFELLLLNAFITILGLLIIRRPSTM